MTLQHTIPRGFFGISRDLPTGSHRVGEENLELAYDMEHRASDALRMNDYSVNARHGTVTKTKDAAGLFGRARDFTGPTGIAFDAAEDNIVATIPSTGSLTAFSWGTWIFPRRSSNTQGADNFFGSDFRVQSKVRSSVGDFGVSSILAFSTGAREFVFAGLGPLNQWYRVIQIGTFSDASSCIRLYVDGVDKGQRCYTTPNAGELNALTSLRWGASNWGSWSGHVDAILDEPFAMPGKALSASEAKSMSLDGRENLYVSSTDSDLGTVRPRRIA